MKKLFLFAVAILLGGCVIAQRDDTQYINIDASTHGTNIPASSTVAVHDDGGLANDYTGGHDWWITLTPDCASMDSTGRMVFGLSLISTEFDVACTDTLYVYDGPTITSPLLLMKNNCFASTENNHVFVSPSNPTGEMTIRFRTAVRDTSQPSHKGFQLSLECGNPCEVVLPVIDTFYERTDLYTGEVVSRGVLTWVPAGFDTTWYYEPVHVVTDTSDYWDTVQTDSIIGIDTTGWVRAAFGCQGQGLLFHGHGEYTYNTGWYTPADSTSEFRWQLDAVLDTLHKNTIPCNAFQSPSCPQVTLKIVDEHGCPSQTTDLIQVRIAQNPIKTIFDLSTICNNDSLLVNVGYDGDNGTLTLKKINFAEVVSKTYEVRTFIPDGQCPGMSKCYAAPVTFEEFPYGRTINSASDICSICINYEHTYMGDYRIAIQCPLYNEAADPLRYQAILKYGKYSTTDPTADPMATPDCPEARNGAGGGDNTGWPTHNDGIGTAAKCDTLENPFGIGLDYCWSRNGDYTLITGDLADFPTHFQPGDWYISHTGNRISPPVAFQLPAMPAYFHKPGGETYSQGDTRTPSNHEEKTNYYSPSSDFTELVGCPLNGEWNAVICDWWGGDNGWIFSWSMDICGIGGGGGGCDYQVGLDSVVWRPDTSETDFRDGLYKGLRINKKWNDTTAAYISSPDTCGDFRIKLSIYDEFGCRWDTLTHIATVCTPLPNLGNDTTLCSVDSIWLDAGDKFYRGGLGNYSFMWEPFGQDTAVVATHTGDYNDMTYIVEVQNAEKNKVCSARDTVVVGINPQPIANFDPGIYPLEGCEPFTINIVNTSTNGYKYHWVFGDGTYSTLKNPSHSYAAGSYDFKYYIESEKGCKDSLIYPGLVTVHKSPQAAFSWEPVYPTVLHPSVSLVNNTGHANNETKYFWEIQYDKDMPYSFHTLTDNNPSFEWSAASGEDISGSYTIRLLARTDNYGPSGNLIQCADTVENTILLINDNLQFPNVVTPNDDGINDRFVIGNLVEGLAYPINQLDIYDKWGSRVYHASNIQSADQFWDPAKTNTPAGTYFYRFSGKGYKGNLEHNGVIEVLK